MAGIKEYYKWIKARKLRWHFVVRAIAGFVLVDQMTGTLLTALPQDAAIVVAALGALFAPLPKEKDKS